MRRLGAALLFQDRLLLFYYYLASSFSLVRITPSSCVVQYSSYSFSPALIKPIAKGVLVECFLIPRRYVI